MDAVLNWLWQGGVVAVALSAMLAALRRARANVRYVVCWMAAMVVLALPVLPSLQSASAVGLVSLPHSDAIVALPNAWWTSTNVIFAAMVLWSAVHLLRVFSAIGATRHARRRSRPFPVHLQSALPHWQRVRCEGRPARLVLSNSVTRAAVFGWGTPVIAVAPSLVRTLEASDLDRVLVHEWAHVQRRDDVVSLLQTALRVVAGWHPAVWWIDRRLHVEREIACDETAVGITGSARSYAECLMKLSNISDVPQQVRLAPAVFARPGLRARVMKIVSPDQPIAPVWSRAMAGAIVVVLCVLSAAVGSVTLVAATALAAPILSVATRTLTVSPHQAVAMARSAATTAEPLTGRRTARSSSMRQPAAGQSSPSSAPEPEPPLPVSRDSREPEPVVAADRSDATRATATEPQPTANAAIDSRSIPAPPQNPPAVTTGTESPWSAAAASGSAIGAKSKNAGLATAGAFRRLAGRIAGSF
jgi:beta-lactamase regulating signal transducer with metallopeptidase domain